MRTMALLLFRRLPRSADDWTTTSGTTYHDVKILKVDKGYVQILHADGGAMIAIEKLPPAIQKNLGYDPDKEKADRLAEQQKEAADAKNKKEALKHPSFIWGSVLQVTQDGVIIQCPDANAVMV